MSEGEIPDLSRATQQVGKPDGTVPPKGLPIEVFSQRIPLPSPQAAEELRLALDEHEGDVTVRDKKSGAWVYVRTRAFVDLKGVAGDTAKGGKDDAAGDGNESTGDAVRDGNVSPVLPVGNTGSDVGKPVDTPDNDGSAADRADA